MDEFGDLQMSYDELADLVIALVQENAAQRKRITQLECQLNDDDEAFKKSGELLRSSVRSYIRNN